MSGYSRAMVHYNPWPLGKIPQEWRRPEPELIRKEGYVWEDPRDIVTIFEKKLADYSNSKYAVLTDCASNALFLCLKYRQLTENKLKVVEVPARTYVSVPMQILHANLGVSFRDEEWSGVYELRNANITDGAGRFTKDMFVGDGNLHVLSFQIKKRLPIGRGGAILTDSLDAYEWLKKASYDGRDLNTPYDSPNHVSQIGWHFYMTPEDAARGILIMDQLDEVLPDTMMFENYPDISKLEIFGSQAS